MSIREEARQEAERRYPIRLPYNRDFEIRDREQKAFEAGAVWASERADREPCADTGCPHEACEIDTAGNPTRCADCGDDLDSVPDWKPSNAEVEAAARKVFETDAPSHEPEEWFTVSPQLRNDYRATARAALLAAQEVRRIARGDTTNEKEKR